MARGRQEAQVSMLAFVDPEELIPLNHPLRTIKRYADAALERLSPLFDEMYAADGRSSIPPERLLKSSLLMSLFSVRSERAFCADLQYNLLYRWFLGMSLLEPSFVPTTFSKNRARLMHHDVHARFLIEVVGLANEHHLLSDDHFTVDGTLIEASASLKSFRPKGEEPPPKQPGGGRNPTVNYRGEKRSNVTHASTTDPESRLAKKSAGKEAKLSYTGHALMENRSGMVVDFVITTATGTAECEATPDLLSSASAQGFHPQTIGADKLYDTKEWVAAMRELGVTPHVAQNITIKRGSAIDGRTTRHPGYAVSQRKRKRVEEIFGWMKTVGGFRRTRYRGLARTKLAGYMVAAAYNLVRMSRLVPNPVGRAC